ncbi:MAG: hypothetical protein ACTFAL_14340 [Candidatus Electronema sp. V4]|uniref:hypothetical protein n=1 Tax=Candidatus Electronema sp. V4 TaxID=3454756 RepID=UPI00405587D4
MTYFRDYRLSADAAAGRVLRKRFPLKKERTVFAPRPGDTVQQLPLLFQAGVADDFPLNFRGDGFDRLLKEGQMSLDALISARATCSLFISCVIMRSSASLRVATPRSSKVLGGDAPERRSQTL